MARSRSDDPVPGDVQTALVDLKVDIEKVTRDEAWARCPYHSERNASWSINLDDGKHNCFSCGAGGTFLDLLLHLRDDMDEEQAREWIRKHSGMLRAAKILRGDNTWKKREAEKVTEADLALFSAPPKEALRSRDITAESCEVFGVLYVPDTERWILPVRDPYTNELRGWQEKGDGYFKNHPEGLVKSDTLFGFDVCQRLGTTTMVIVVESPLDAVRLWTYGYAAVATYGVNVSAEQMRLLAETFDIIVLALDNDRAGDKVSVKMWKEYLGRARLRYFNYGDVEDKDPGTMHIDDIDWAVDNAVSAVSFRASS